MKQLAVINDSAAKYSFPTDLKIPALEELYLKKCDLLASRASTIFKTASRLKSLSLESCSNTGLILDGGSIDCVLTTLILIRSDITTNKLYHFLKKTSRLKTLKLIDCKGIVGNFDADLELPELEEIELTDSFINTNGVYQLIKKSPRLKRLALVNCKNIAGNFDTDLNFPELEEIDLSHTSINDNGVCGLLQKTLRLNRVTLSHCTGIEGHFTVDLELPELIIIDLSQSSITNELLERLVAKSPKLSYLRLDNCYYLDPTMTAKLKRDGLTIHSSGNGKIDRKRSGFFEQNPQQKRSRPSTVLPVPYHRHNKNIPVDANTQSTEETFHVDRIFMGKPTSPDPRELRYQIFDFFSLNERSGMKEPFILQSMDHGLSSLSHVGNCQVAHPLHGTYENSATGHYFCRTSINITHDWQALPSAFADEKLKSFYINHSAEVHLAKSAKTQLYYIRLKNKTKQPQAVTLEMLLTRQKPKQTINNLPEEVLSLIKGCRGFREEALKNIAPNATGQDFLDALIEQRAGACRHRSIVFMHLMQQRHSDIPVRLVSNAVHMFAEVFFEESWITCDLGGYPAHIQVNEQGLPQYRPGEPLESDPIETYTQTLSDTGKPLAPDFFSKARNLTTLTLDECSRLPLDYDLSMLDTLNIISSPLTKEGLSSLLGLAPNLKTLSIKHCRLAPGAFNALDFSCLTHLEHVSLRGRFIPNMESVTRLMKTAPEQTRWVVESDNVALEDTQQMVGLKSSTPRSNIEIRQKTRSLPSRYFANRKRHLTAKKEAFDILKSSGQSTSVRKTLVNTNDAEDARLILQKTSFSLGQLYYYIDSPDALRCAGPYIRREGLLGHVEKKAGGPLYDFIMNYPGKIKNIIIDYNAFKLSDFASFNSVLDEPSTLDSILLPHEVHLIGLLSQNNSQVYQGADFYSRFDAFETMTYTEHWPTLRPTPLTDHHSSTEIIELCGGDQWEARLIGHWLLQEGRLIFKEGLLLNALKANKSSFSFNNAPLHDASFMRFLHDLTLHPNLLHQGHDYGRLPADFNVVLTQGAHISDKTHLLTLDPDGALTRDHIMLNHANLSAFLGRYLVDQTTHQLIFQEGLIEQHQGIVMPIYLTSSLSFYTWLKLLEACKKHQTVLQIILAPDVTFPQELDIDTTRLVCTTRLNSTANTQFNPAELPKNANMVIDVSELKTDELFATFKCNGFNADKNQFEFTPISICPWDALKEQKTVVLKGEWTQELADAVQAMMFERMQQENPPGTLIVLSQANHPFKAFPKISLGDCMRVVPKTLDVQVDYDKRLEAVETVLNEHPFVLITGATGIGKTHFVSRTWKDKHPVCYYGEKQIVNFLENKSTDEFITLYINEANLANKDWSLFEGLFNDPPAIFYNNHYYLITPRHKIIFDGNPISYGGERHTPKLFKNHPCQLHFQPLPRNVLASMIDLKASLSAPILDVVMYMASLTPDDTLLTPREIKMMGSLVKAYATQYPHVQPEVWARYVAYTLGQNHVPRTFQHEFEKRFKVELPLPIADFITRMPDISNQNDQEQAYLLNNTNLPAAIALEGHLMVREARRKQVSHHSLEIGLGGLVVEGVSGEGKSQLILNQLLAHGYEKNIDFIHIPAKSKPNEIKDKLLEGFHEGQIVVIDEMNSLPMPEQLLNALLEGHDLDDHLPRKPGFLLIGTQNPITYRGRLKITAPLAHRLQKIVLPASTLLEKNQILAKMGLPSRIAQDILGEYSKRSDLTFRKGEAQVLSTRIQSRGKRPISGRAYGPRVAGCRDNEKPSGLIV